MSQNLTCLFLATTPANPLDVSCSFSIPGPLKRSVRLRDAFPLSVPTVRRKSKTTTLDKVQMYYVCFQPRGRVLESLMFGSGKIATQYKTKLFSAGHDIKCFEKQSQGKTNKHTKTTKKQIFTVRPSQAFPPSILLMNSLFEK